MDATYKKLGAVFLLFLQLWHCKPKKVAWMKGDTNVSTENRENRKHEIDELLLSDPKTKRSETLDSDRLKNFILRKHAVINGMLELKNDAFQVYLFEDMLQLGRPERFVGIFLMINSKLCFGKTKTELSTAKSILKRSSAQLVMDYAHATRLIDEKTQLKPVPFVQQILPVKAKIERELEALKYQNVALIGILHFTTVIPTPKQIVLCQLKKSGVASKLTPFITATVEINGLTITVKIIGHPSSLIRAVGSAQIKMSWIPVSRIPLTIDEAKNDEIEAKLKHTFQQMAASDLVLESNTTTENQKAFRPDAIYAASRAEVVIRKELTHYLKTQRDNVALDVFLFSVDATVEKIPKSVFVAVVSDSKGVVVSPFSNSKDYILNLSHQEVKDIHYAGSSELSMLWQLHPFVGGPKDGALENFFRKDENEKINNLASEIAAKELPALIVGELKWSLNKYGIKGSRQDIYPFIAFQLSAPSHLENYFIVFKVVQVKGSNSSYNLHIAEHIFSDWEVAAFNMLWFDVTKPL